MPVKRMYKLIYAFLPAFLLGLTVADSPRVGYYAHPAKEGFDLPRQFNCLHLNYKQNKRPRLFFQITAGAWTLKNTRQSSVDT